jgi:large subunit ribosomal protein LP1
VLVIKWGWLPTCEYVFKYGVLFSKQYYKLLEGNMAHVEVSALTKQQKDELVCTYAALMLHDGELEISEEKLKKVITASGNSVEGYWPGLFAKALKGKNIADMLQNGGAAAAPAGGAPAAAAAEAPAADKKAEKSK